MTTWSETVLPQGCIAKFVPRIRCFDCPGKLYTAGPEHSVANFQLHLKNRNHQNNLKEREIKEMASSDFEKVDSI
ncbi:hypothetical protein K505DRAFT_253811 [Melanomma pulvis-pyrius CBS 109.77]|uniref:Uncharacterized protein n=1 Tax=Melanomma pulvis-pyrius CBS 109.77 TaxID=1314802 RepID=A0A6A6WYN2_9PLEO|nr:hypothetical protein K505DRAFT_253811 [Melanomma pulvis-pyrius CBS 109.77]